jgi:peptidoglycan/xylan/chitin deacetylase (PgdA/CDA1 family)
MLRLAKHTLCSVYKYSGIMRVQEAVAQRLWRPFLAVLLFHRVTDEIPEDGLTVSTARFRQICRMLRRTFHVVSLAEVCRLRRLGQPIPAHTVAITFDDCYRDNLFAARILAEHGLPACFFVPAAMVGTDHVFDWDRKLTPMANLSWDEVREMADLGFDIGSHTLSHPNLAAIPRDQARREIVDSRKVIEDKIGRAVPWFAYPFGGRDKFRTDLLPFIAEGGYEACFSGFGGFIYQGTTEAILPREAVPYFHSVVNLELHLRGCLNWVYELKRRAGGAIPPCPEKVRGLAGSCRCRGNDLSS